MKIGYTLACLFFISTVAFAQFGVDVGIHYGAIVEDEPDVGPDRWGHGSDMGISLTYTPRKDTSSWLKRYRLRLGRQHVTGLATFRHFTREVPPLDQGSSSTVVNLRAHVPGFQAYTLGVGLMTSMNFRRPDRFPRFHASGEFGILRIDKDLPTIEWFEQTLDGERIEYPPTGDYFFFQNGEIIRYRPGRRSRPFDDSALRRYQAYGTIQIGYLLTPYLQLTGRCMYTYGSIGRRYGDRDTLLGFVQMFQFGLIGQL